MGAAPFLFPLAFLRELEQNHSGEATCEAASPSLVSLASLTPSVDYDVAIHNRFHPLIDSHAAEKEPCGLSLPEGSFDERFFAFLPSRHWG